MKTIQDLPGRIYTNPRPITKADREAFIKFFNELKNKKRIIRKKRKHADAA
jgi:hypothetical protein